MLLEVPMNDVGDLLLRVVDIGFYLGFGGLHMLLRVLCAVERCHGQCRFPNPFRSFLRCHCFAPCSVIVRLLRERSGIRLCLLCRETKPAIFVLSQSVWRSSPESWCRNCAFQSQ